MVLPVPPRLVRETGHSFYPRVNLTVGFWCVDGVMRRIEGGDVYGKMIQDMVPLLPAREMLEGTEHGTG